MHEAVELWEKITKKPQSDIGLKFKYILQIRKVKSLTYVFLLFS